MKRITAIDVPARFALDGGEPRVAVAHFRLGLGPCGEVVERLRLEYRRHFVVVGQLHSDGSSAEFAYAHEQLTGRIEVQRG